MSKDNLILFPIKSKPRIGMTNAEAKWMISGTLVVVLTIALGINSTLFSQQSRSSEANTQVAANQSGNRSIASVNPIFRVSWEKKAFEVLEKTKERDLANIGKKPSVFDNFAFGSLEGRYQIRKVDGKISEVRLEESGDVVPKVLQQRGEFLNKNLALFSESAKLAKRIHVEDNEEVVIEKYELRDENGQGLGQVQFLIDKDEKLLSMTVQ